MKIMVAYDGTLQAKEALVYGMDKAREQGGEVVALHVFNSGMFVDYDVMDAEATARRESGRIVEEAKTLLREKGNGVRTSFFTIDGDPADEVVAFAKEKRVDVLLCPPRFRKIISGYEKALQAHDLAGDAAGRNLAALAVKTM